MKAVKIFAERDLRLVDEEISSSIKPDQVKIGIDWGGICGSDISYFLHGRSGTVLVKEPLIVGHEFAGVVLETGANVLDLKIGDKVAVYPSKAIEGITLPERLSGKDNLLAKVEYYGSAALPTDGGFVEEKIVDASQAKKLPDGVSTKLGALAEPLSVAAHAVNRALEVSPDDVLDNEILINGAGPIGLLILAWLKFKGAKSVAVSDISEKALETAKQVGADKIINVKNEKLPEDVETAFEATGVMAVLDSVFLSAARGGTVVQVGNLPIDPGESVLGQLVTRELNYLGSFRFTEKEFEEVVSNLGNVQNLEKIVTHSFPLNEYKEAFNVTVDKSFGAAKVLVNISSEK